MIAQSQKAATEEAKSNEQPAYSVLGVRVNAVQIPGVLREMEHWINARDRCRYIAVTGMHGVTEAQHDSHFGQALAAADLVVPDGMPLVWLGRRKGLPIPRRVYGPELMEYFWQHTDSYKHFLYGATPAVLDALARKLTVTFPAHTIVGALSPPFRPLTTQEDQDEVDSINETSPDIIWVGLGTPKQERWMYEHRNRLNARVLVGVGAAFDFYAGRVRRAPSWMGEHGLEWLFRLSQEPRRLWRRYLIQGAQFTALALLELFGIKKFD